MNYLHELVKGKTGEEAVSYLLGKGLIPATIIMHAEVLSTYNEQIKTKPLKEAMIDTARIHKIDRCTIYRIIKRFRE